MIFFLLLLSLACYDGGKNSTGPFSKIFSVWCEIGSSVYIYNWLVSSRKKWSIGYCSVLKPVYLQFVQKVFSNVLGCFRSVKHREAIFKLEHKYALVKADILWLHNLSHRTTHGWGDWHIKFKWWCSYPLLSSKCNLCDFWNVQMN